LKLLEFLYKLIIYSYTIIINN